MRKVAKRKTIEDLADSECWCSVCTSQDVVKDFEKVGREKFTKELIKQARSYLTKRTGQDPEDEFTIDFLMKISNLGLLFLKNTPKLIKER